MRQQGVEQTRYNKLPLDHQHVDHQEQVHSRHLRTMTGNLQVHLVDRQAHLKSLGLAQRTAGVEPTVQSAQQMFWKYWTTLLGERVSAAVSHKGGEAERNLRHDARRTIRAHEKHVTWSGMEYLIASSLVQAKMKDTPDGHVWNGLRIGL
jgi:hypothetical protein